MRFLRYVFATDPQRQVLLLLLVLTSVVLSLAPIHLLRAAVGELIPAGDLHGVFVLAGVTLACVLARAFVEFLQTMTVEVIRNNVITRLRSELLDHVLHLGAEWHGANPVGKTTNQIQNDVGRLGVSVAWIFVQPLVEGMTVLVYLLYLAALSPPLALASLVLVPAVVAALPALSRAHARHASEFIAARGDYSARLQQSLLSVDEIQAHGTWSFERAAVDRAQARIADAWLRLTRVQALLAGMTELARGIGAVAVLTLAAWLVLRAGGSLATLVAVTGVLGGLYAAADRLLKYPPLFRNALDRFAELSAVLDHPRRFACAAAEHGAGAVHIERMTYRLPERGALFADLTLTVPAGQHVALVGRSGSGKSTLLRILSGGIGGYEGEVRIAGAAPSVRSPWFGYVPQAPALLPGSLRDNLLYGLQRRDAPAQGSAPFLDLEPLDLDASDRPALDAHLLRVCERVGLLPDLAALASAGAEGRGLGFDPGERGARLSGGQRQKLALARVLLRRPSVLLLDEISAGLDRASAAQVEEALALQWRGQTVIAATHDRAWLPRFDRVIVLSQGAVVADGPPAAVLRDGALLAATADVPASCIPRDVSIREHAGPGCLERA